MEIRFAVPAAARRRQVARPSFSAGDFPPMAGPESACPVVCSRKDPARLSSREMRVESAVEAHSQRVHALP
jgi:hypothetical protein